MKYVMGLALSDLILDYQLRTTNALAKLTSFSILKGWTIAEVSNLQIEVQEARLATNNLELIICTSILDKYSGLVRLFWLFRI